mmetsp:Transcript_1009/g.2810  ORF Transcript_1009/g.2810 Transcript_1009/m.2810 type:complete len:83 (+) Transcript_1009:78-326(+)
MFAVCVATTRQLVPVACWYAEAGIAGAETDDVGRLEVEVVPPPDDAWRGHVKRDWIRAIRGELLIIEKWLLPTDILMCATAK